MKINAVMCSTCNQVIYSRARHDFCTCDCGDTSVDGGFNYQSVSFKNSSPRPVIIEVKATRKQLFDDWTKRIDKFGKGGTICKRRSRKRKLK